MARMALLAMFITEMFLLSSVIASMANEAICIITHAHYARQDIHDG